MFSRNPYGPACKVTSSLGTILNLTAGGGAQIAVFDTNVFDTDGIHSVTSNTDKIYLTKAGYWDCGFNVLMSSQLYTLTELVATLVLNGTTNLATGIEIMPAGTDQPSIPSPPTPVKCTTPATDYINLSINCVNGSNCGVLGGANDRTYMWAMWRRPL